MLFPDSTRVTFIIKVHNATPSTLFYQLKLISDDCVLYGLTPFPASLEPFRAHRVKVQMVYGTPSRSDLVDGDPERRYSIRIEVPVWKYRQVGDYNRRIDLDTTYDWLALTAQGKEGAESHLHYVAWI
jgi:hypothetical protein